MHTLFIHQTGHNGNITIKRDENDKQIYVGYTLRQAIKNYRQRYNLVGRHLEIIRTVAL